MRQPFLPCRAGDRVLARRGVSWIAAVVFCSLGIPLPADASSIRIYDQSASAAGQASAFVAQADDASAGYYNPAGMTQLRGMQFSLGADFMGGGFNYRNSAGQTVHGDLQGAAAIPPPGNWYATAHLRDLGLKFSDTAVLGLAVFTPFGTLTRWPDNGPFATATTTAAFELLDIRPSVAFKPFHDLAVGVGADIYTFSGLFGEGHVERKFHWPGGLGIPAGANMELTGTDTAAGFNVSLLYTALRNADERPLVNIGLMYRSQATLHLHGQLLANGAHIADSRTTFVVPQVLIGGIAVWPIRDQAREWKLELDVDYTGWKSVRNLNSSLSNGFTVPVPANWISGYTIMIGTEYKWLKPHILPQWDIALRAGYWNAQRAIPDTTYNPAIPDADNHAISVGLGLFCEGNGRFLGLIACSGTGRTLRPAGMGVDFAYKAILFETRTVSGNINPTVNGTYGNTLHVGSINIRVNF